MTNAVTYTITLQDMYPSHMDEEQPRCGMCDKELAIFRVGMSSHKGSVTLNAWSKLVLCMICTRKLTIAYINTADALSYGPSTVKDLIREGGTDGRMVPE